MHVGTVLSKYGEIIVVRKRTVQGRSVIGSLAKGYEREKYVHGGKEG